MNPSQPLLTARDLSIGYAGRQSRRVVAGSLDLDLWPGQLVCLLGPNGAGKSTLMRTLAGLQSPLSGHVALGASRLDALPAGELARKLSLVLSERVEAGNLLVGELVALGRTPHTGWLGGLTPADRDQIRAAMEATGTLPFRDRRLHQLSDGERQKVMLARALAQDTDLILLDEPTAHLDLPNRVEMMQLLHGLTRQTGKAILLSTHELDLALQTADALWLLDPQGRLRAGTPEDLVLNGAFESTFAKRGFYFDRTTGTFALHPTTPGPALGLTGDESLMFWTRRALQREGFAVTSSGEAVGTIEALFREGSPFWVCGVEGQRREFQSVQTLLQALLPLKYANGTPVTLAGKP